MCRDADEEGPNAPNWTVKRISWPDIVAGIELQLRPAQDWLNIEVNNLSPGVVYL